LRDLAVEAEIFPPAVTADVLSHYAGVILSELYDRRDEEISLDEVEKISI
jgi:hypothetical protein